MARKARGPDATSAKLDPSGSKGKKQKKMGLAAEVRGMLPKSNDKAKLSFNTNGRKISSSNIVNLSTNNEESDSSTKDEDFEVVDEHLSEENDEDLIPENEQDIDELSGDELDGNEDSAEFSDSSEGSEDAEIDVRTLDNMQDVDWLEVVDVEAIGKNNVEAAEEEASVPADDGMESSDASQGQDDAQEELINEEQDSIDQEDESDDGEESEEELALSDIDEDLDKDNADIVTVTRETVNNVAALNAAYNRIALELPEQFSLHQTLTTEAPILVADVNDDLAREVEFYKQGLAHATTARDLIRKEGAAWERPSDYFAEMVKTDDHMERIRKELLQEATAKKASADARRQRELKKFGKQVQINKNLDRAKEKKQTVDKLKALKRKRGDNELEGKEDFDVALDEAVAKPDSKRTRGSSAGGRGPGGRGTSRDARDQKFGFGGKKRFSKSNTAESTYDMAGFNNSKPGRSRGGRGALRGSSRGGRGGSRGGSARPGKSKRH